MADSLPEWLAKELALCNSEDVEPYLAREIIRLNQALAMANEEITKRKAGYQTLNAAAEAQVAEWRDTTRTTGYDGAQEIVTDLLALRAAAKDADNG